MSKPLSKTAGNIAKTMGATGNNDNTATSKQNSRLDAILNPNKASGGNSELTLAQQKELLQKFEAEVMGEQEENKGTKSEIRARNYEQMVGVLKHKLKALEAATKKRMYLLDKDLDNFSSECSKATKITDDFDDLNFQKLPKDIKTGNYHRDNLVSSDTVFVDPVHLVVRTKQTTETGKKLEAQLEECFGSVNLRELKGKKSKGSISRSEKPKKSIRQKNEAKKQARNRLEKLLHANMENYVTRSVNDVDMKFHAPASYDDPPNWPVSVKFSVDDPKDQQAITTDNNSDGDMNLRVLLLYAIERITLQSGEALFKRLAKERIMQEYLLCLFWLVKLKFFQPDSTDHDEGYLLQMMSKNYVKIVEFMAVIAHAEYEKDYVFKYLPFIFCNAIYYAFHSLFPGSRHIYTRAFRKTILIQVVQVMHGVQLSQLSVKVSWAKLFPDDIQEGAEEDGDEAGESFPVQLAFSKRPRSAGQYEKLHMSHSVHDQHKALHITHSVPHLPMNATTFASSPTTRSHGGMLATGANEGGAPTQAPTPGIPPSSANHSVPHSAPHSVSYSAPATAASSSSAMSSGLGNTAPSSHNLLNDTNMPSSYSTGALPPLSAPLNRTTSGASNNTASNIEAALGIAGVTKLGRTKKDTNRAKTEEIDEALIGKLPTILPTERTMLKPPHEKPSGLQHLTIRQNKETVDAKEISPVMQQFLYQGSERGFRCAQPMARIAPVSWCVAGGSDTHRRRHIPKQLLEEISTKAADSKKEYLDDIPKFRRQRLRTIKKITTACQQVLSSNQQAISRFSLDLLKQKRLHNKALEKDGQTVTSLEDFNGQEGTAFLEKYANYEDEDIEAFLETIGESL